MEKNLERNISVFQQEHMKLWHTNPQVSIRKLVRDVEAERPEFAPLQANTVEEAEREQKPLEGLDFGVLGVEEVVELWHLVQVSSQQVGL